MYVFDSFVFRFNETAWENESNNVVPMFELLLTEQRRGGEETERSHRRHDVFNA